MSRFCGWLLLLAASTSTVAQARLAEYTRDVSGPNQIALGIEVPQAVDSSSPLAGFRAYSALIDQLEWLALQSPYLQRRELGRSLQQRPILGFRFGQSTEAVMLQSGGAHAREWASPEAVAHIIERLVAAADEGGLESWLRDHSAIILVPVLNPDGFIASQNQPRETTIGEDPDDNNDPQQAESRQLTPRDGRMRRKNLRDSDGDLTSGDDTLLGVDLNRNLPPFWASSSRSSNDPASIVYHGSSAESEPETRALIAASQWQDSDQLRLFIDTHSFGRVLFYNRSGNQALFSITRDLVELIRRTPPQNYSALQETSGVGIGASDEYFAYQRQVPSYTLEIEPGSAQLAEYGGNAGVSHAGFILPESQVPRMREEIYQMARLAYYHQAGPAILRGWRIVDRDDERVLVAARWQDQGAQRTLRYSANEALSACGRYRAELDFSKPMRLRDANGGIQGYPGQAAPLAPVIQLGERELAIDNAAWQDADYQADRYSFEFALAGRQGTQVLDLSLRDLAGMALDSKPASIVSWRDGQWQDWEDEQGVAGLRGGSDRNMLLEISADNGCAAPDSAGGSGGLGLLLLSVLLAWRRLR